MWWQRKQVRPANTDRPERPVRSPEEIERDQLARKAYWDENRPIHTFRVTYLDGVIRDVVAHYSQVSVTEGRVSFFKYRYTEYVGEYMREPRDIVYWGLSHQIRSVEMIEE